MQYSAKVMKHFTNPHNQGRIDNASAVGEVGNPLCGDIMKIYIKIKKASRQARDKAKEGKRRQKRAGRGHLEDVIEDIKFETLGCAAAIACSSILTDMAKGKTLKEAFEIERSDIVKGLGNLPPVKIHCSVLASDGLKLAIKNYLEKQGAIDQYPEIKNFSIQECSHEQ